MSKPTLIYAAILTVSVGGVWGLLRAGSQMKTVADIAGTWEIHSGPLGPGTGGPEHLGDSVTIEQSGRFLRLKFASGQTLDMKAEEAPLGSIDAPVRFRMTDGQRTLVATIYRGDDELAGDFRITGGRRPAQFSAVRQSHAESADATTPRLKTDGEE